MNSLLDNNDISTEMIKQEIKVLVKNEKLYQTWFANTSVSLDEEQNPLLLAPNAFARNWIERKYFNEISQHIENKWNVQISLDIAPKGHQANTRKLTHKCKELTPSQEKPKVKHVTHHFSFERYIAGHENTLAITAAKLLHESSDHYNSPFIIVGGHGLGKTHLAMAIGSEYAEHERVVLHAEEFGNEFIIAAKENKLEAFRATIRNKKLFIIEDIDFFLEGIKKKTLEELINTLKVLRRDHRQIVITTSKPLAEYQNVSPKLFDILLSGLKVRLKEPSTETRNQYTREFIKRHQTRFSEKAINFINDIPFKSIRELDGALKQLVAFSIIEKDKLPLQVVKDVLSDHLRDTFQSNANTTGGDLHSTATQVCKAFGISFVKITSNSRERHITLARHTAMALSYNENHCTLKEIGQFYGGKLHQSVLYAIQKISEKRKKDLEFRKIYDKLCSKIKTQQSV